MLSISHKKKYRIFLNSRSRLHNFHDLIREVAVYTNKHNLKTNLTQSAQIIRKLYCYICNLLHL